MKQPNLRDSEQALIVGGSDRALIAHLIRSLPLHLYSEYYLIGRSPRASCDADDWDRRARAISPLRAKQQCRYVGCKNPATCDGRHARRYDFSALYNSPRWRYERKQFLLQHPFCVMCPLPPGTFATEVDHIKPHRGNLKLFWDPENWQSLCKRHHSAKTLREIREER